jgi:hypothetical protein
MDRPKSYMPSGGRPEGSGVEMSNITQLFTLLGVLIGAASSYVAQWLGDRAGSRRETVKRWEERKLDAYCRYVNDVKDVALHSREVAGMHSFRDSGTTVASGESLGMLDEAELRRELSTELLTLIAGDQTILAYRKLNRAVGRLEWFARGVPPDVQPAEWAQAFEEYEEAFDAFYTCVRDELGVPSPYLPRDPLVRSPRKTG